LEVIEINFGFQLVSVAGVQVEEKKTDCNEFSAIKQEGLAKEQAIGFKDRIYEKNEFELVIAQLITTVSMNFEPLLTNTATNMSQRI
jgi:hypothetical protein